MKKGRKPITKDQAQGLCACGNKQMPGPKSVKGFKTYCSYCSKCAKRNYDTPKTIKSYAVNKKPFCELCGFVAINSCQLDVDHKDGNHNNDDPNNLQTL